MENTTQPTNTKPANFTDTDNARLFALEYEGKAIYTTTNGWLVWNGKKWEENDLKAVDLAMRLTDKMLAEARDGIRQAGTRLAEAKAGDDTEELASAKEADKVAMAYLKHALSSRNKNKIAAMLTLAQPLLAVKSEKLDADPNLLNTPAGVVDLCTGAILPHDPDKLCTKITRFSPGERGCDIWARHLALVSCEDEKWIGFEQQVAGMSAFGKVFEENLIIKIGGGRNGKSAHTNAQASVLGDYAGTISADALTTAGRSKGADLANLKGLRLVIAAETDEGARLSTSMLKQLTSTDKIHAERKYRDPEDFTPSHTVVLYTNHFPRVGSTDTGTWRRIVPVPFDAQIPESREVKNYAEVLSEEAGEAIMAWIVEGAVAFHKQGYRLIKPECVENLFDQYRQENDWLGEFIDECCETGIGLSCLSGKLFSQYVEWGKKTHGYTRRSDEFKREMEKKGYASRRSSRGVEWIGIEVNDELSPKTYWQAK
jgi:P4 family phage/plasmid primase-like protien